MASLNINSFLAHIGEFRIPMNESNVHETKLDSSIGDNKVYIPGYEIVWKDGITSGDMGVVFVLCKCNLNYKIYNLEYFTV